MKKLDLELFSFNPFWLGSSPYPEGLHDLFHICDQENIQDRGISWLQFDTFRNISLTKQSMVTQDSFKEHLLVNEYEFE